MENFALIDSFSEFKDDKLIDRVTLMVILEDVFKNTLKRELAPIKIKSEAKKISFKRGISIYKVKITSLNNRIVFADGEITHFVPLKFSKKK